MDLARLRYYQIFFIIATMAITANSVNSLQAKLGLPISSQVAGWVILGLHLPFSYIWHQADYPSRFRLAVIGSAFPFAVTSPKSSPESRILSYFLAFSVCFVILSISVEGLFYAAYSVTLYVWTEVEVAVRRARTDKSESESGERDRAYVPQADDLRIAVFFLFFVQVGFFGTGK